MTQLRFPQAPRLPDPPVGPESGYFNGLLNALRLFFNQLHGAFSAILGPNGGRYIDCPNGLFYHTGSQTLAAANTGYPVQFNQTYLSNAIRVVGGTQITADIGGVYNFQYSGCVESTNSSSKNVYLWIARNGTPIRFSTNGYTLVGAGTLGVIARQFNIDLQVGDYIELYWAATDVNVTLTTKSAATPHTGIPASVCAVNFIAPLPTVLPTPP